MAKKRANGEGSIRRKPNGRWEGRYTLGIDPATGRAIQKSVSAKTRAECKEKLDRAIRDNRGIPMDHNEDYTVAEWCRLWFETYSKPVIRPNTAKNYRNIIENHIVPAIGMVKLKRLTAIQIQQMYNNSKAKGRVQRFDTQTSTALSGSTVRRIPKQARYQLRYTRKKDNPQTGERGTWIKNIHAGAPEKETLKAAA